jgi:hypothetical protein
MDRSGATVLEFQSSNLMTMRHAANGLSPISDTSSTPDRSPLKTSFQGPDNHSINGGDVAHRACEKCRSSKRRCDKTLPYCTRCSRYEPALLPRSLQSRITSAPCFSPVLTHHPTSSNLESPWRAPVLEINPLIVPT